ncbi:MAG TPA: hypothetical protein VGL38_09570 [bacterium]|jgi:hypothetical protein
MRKADDAPRRWCLLADGAKALGLKLTDEAQDLATQHKAIKMVDGVFLVNVEKIRKALEKAASSRGAKGGRRGGGFNPFRKHVGRIEGTMRRNKSALATAEAKISGLQARLADRSLTFYDQETVLLAIKKLETEVVHRRKRVDEDQAEISTLKNLDTAGRQAWLAENAKSKGAAADADKATNISSEDSSVSK